MIINTPDAEDFFTTGKDLLSYSWGIITKLVLDLHEAEEYGNDIEEISDEYWSLAERQVSIALTISQQGIELLLKGKITEISPFLLLSEPPSRWPKPNKKTGIEFSQYRTIDAQDLIKVLDAVSQSQLLEEFVVKFEDMRQKRNKIMHSIDNTGMPNFIEMLESILLMHHLLFPNETFGPVRLNSLSDSPDVKLGSDEWVYNKINLEFDLIIQKLAPAKVKRFFKVDKRKRAYFCPKCLENANSDVEFEHKLARLVVDKDALFCPVCNQEYPIVRRNCDNGCKGSVIHNNDHYEEDRCLICGN